MWNNTYGQSLYDYPHLEISPYALDYNDSQRIFIGAECDFSFTTSLIRKRNGGLNCCSTSFYTIKEWNMILREVGIDEEAIFKQNLAFCKANQCKVTFAIDGTNIARTEHKWTDNKLLKFDRIIYTFPRKYQYDEEITTDQYNQENAKLYFNLLKSAKSYLNKNGEIHVMLFPNLFWAFNLKYSLDKLDLEISALADLSNNNSLNKIFHSYTPRDTYGNYIRLYKRYTPPKMYKIYMCCFKIKSHYLVKGTFRFLPRTANKKDNKPLFVHGLWANCTNKQLYNLFRRFGVISESGICGDGIGMVRFQQRFEAQVAMSVMNGRKLDGCLQKLTVFYNKAKSKTKTQNINYESKTQHTQLQDIRYNMNKQKIKKKVGSEQVTVFMGGFSRGTNVVDLNRELTKQRIVMTSCGGIQFAQYGYSYVRLLSDKDAKCLISLSPIQIKGKDVYIEPLAVAAPSERVILNFIIELLARKKIGNRGLSVEDIQWKLFEAFSSRVNYGELSEIIKYNPECVYYTIDENEQIDRVYKRSRTKYYNSSRKYLAAKKRYQYTEYNHRNTATNTTTTYYKYKHRGGRQYYCKIK